MSDPFYGHVGAAIRTQREAIAMTQAALAAQVGLSRTTITNIEAGRQALFLHQAIALASALRVQVDAFLPPAIAEQPEHDVEPEAYFTDLLSRLSTSKEPRRGKSR